MRKIVIPLSECESAMGLRTILIFLMLASSIAHASSCNTFSCYQDESLRCAASNDADDGMCRERVDQAIAAAKTEDELLEAAFGRVARKMHFTSQHLRQTSSDETLISKWQDVDIASQLCMQNWSKEHYLNWRRAYLDAGHYMKSKGLSLRDEDGN
jgi:hypothetical protein